MKMPLTKPCQYVVAVILFFSTLVSSLADWTLGRSSFEHAAARNLKTKASLKVNFRGGAPRASFVRRVGGVAFDSIAKPADGYDAPDSVDLIYDPEKPDGQRLRITLDGQTVSAPVYDWELIPIAKFAASGSSNCFTLFGTLKNEGQQRELQEKGARILNYDEAFEDTLLGMRLFQLDVLVLDAEYSVDLPKKDGKYVLGEGEVEPKSLLARLALTSYARKLGEIRKLAEEQNFDTNFQSYVICDYWDGKKLVSFKPDGGKLELSGEPYYYFWKGDEKLSLEHFVSQELNERKLLRKGETINEFLQRMQKEARASESPAAKVKEIEKLLGDVIGIARKKHQAANAEDVKEVYLKQYSEEHAKLTSHLAKMNPAVWNAARKTMRYSAFFRYVKKNHPEAWTKFIKEFKQHNPKATPQVQTPTVLMPPPRREAPAPDDEGDDQ